MERRKDGHGQIISKRRVADHGEVFTAEREVRAMCDLVPKDVLERPQTKVLEPACGRGAFLVEILRRRMNRLGLHAPSIAEFNYQALQALSSMYGIDIQRDNVLACRQAVFDAFCGEYGGRRVCAQAMDIAGFILEGNIVFGDSLKLEMRDVRRDGPAKPLRLREWDYERWKQTEKGLTLVWKEGGLDGAAPIDAKTGASSGRKKPLELLLKPERQKKMPPAWMERRLHRLQKGCISDRERKRMEAWIGSWNEEEPVCSRWFPFDRREMNRLAGERRTKARASGRSGAMKLARMEEARRGMGAAGFAATERLKRSALRAYSAGAAPRRTPRKGGAERSGRR